MVEITKKFNNKDFFLYGVYSSKNQARNIADNIRANATKKGKVRVVKESSGFAIYTRGC